MELIEGIKKNKRIKIIEVEKMWEIGTPQDLEKFLSEYDGFI